MTDQASETPALPNRQTPFSDPFKAFIVEGWQPYPTEPPAALTASAWTSARRQAISAQFPADRLVLPAGGLKQRANDTDYVFRAHSAFAHLSGLGADREPDSVLVLDPRTGATLYFKPRSPRTDPEFYADARYGEMWVGTRESISEMEALTGLPCRPLTDLPDALIGDSQVKVRIVREADPVQARWLDELRSGWGIDQQAMAGADDELLTALSELRLIKDDFELDQLRQACTATLTGFEAVIADLPEAIRRGRGERWAEGVFGLHARHLGNAVGYDSIVASGDHANTLHWIRNNGDIRSGDLLLLDAGVELDSLYTADITRTLPVSGRYAPAQRQVYLAVLEAQQAGIDAARPGARFSDVHEAAIAVIAEHLERWGILPVSARESLDPTTGGHHRRWMVHGTSHHLGLDVHDCAQARRESYRDAELRPGMVITVEPGLYFKATDLLVPEELRGIGVRIEDDIAITDGPAEILSQDFPRHPDDVEAWIAGIWER